jgi:hypothetical protein
MGEVFYVGCERSNEPDLTDDPSDDYYFDLDAKLEKQSKWMPDR